MNIVGGGGRNVFQQQQDILWSSADDVLKFFLQIMESIQPADGP
jgi:hypothetical protein